MGDAVTATFPATPAPAPAPANVPAAGPARPDWLPAQFNDPAAFAKSWADQQSHIGKLQAEVNSLRGAQPATPGQPATPAANPTPAAGDFNPLDFVGADTPSGPAAPAAPAEVQSVLAKAGVDFDALSAEFSKDGKLSEDSYKKLTDAGFPKEVVDTYVQNATKAMKADAEAALKTAGFSADTFTAAVEWAQTGLTKEQIDAYEEAVNSGNTARVNQALVALKAAHERSKGSAPNLVQGNPGPAVTGYRDRSEWLADIAKPEYQVSEAFRNDVAKKLAMSPALV